MNKKYTVIIALIAIVVVLIFVYRVRISTKIQPPTFVPSGEIKTQDSNVYGFIIEGKEYSFNPSRIEIEGGKRVRLVFQNRGTVPHNLEVECPGLPEYKTRTINPGQEDYVEFNVPSSGVCEFYCDLPGHKDKGMKGEIIIR